MGTLKVSLGLLVALASFVLWKVRERQARERLREIDEGRRCIACDGTSLVQNDGVARCLRCGQTVSLVALRAASLSPDEIATITKPPASKL